MGAKAVYLLAPLLVLIIFATIASGNANSIQGQSARVGVCDPQNCVGQSGGNTYTCDSNDPNFQTGVFHSWNQCRISDICITPTPLGAECPNIFVTSIEGIPGGTYIGQGATVFVPTSQVNQVQSTTSNVFIFGSVTSSGFTVMILVAVGLVALAGLNIFGSGESPESIHILFMAGMLMGLWLILSAVEGYIVGSSASGFGYIDQVTPNLGTGMYVLLTLFYTFGAVQSVSRGGA